MPNLYWIIVYGTMAILVGYVLYDIVISELITLNVNQSILNNVKSTLTTY